MDYIVRISFDNVQVPPSGYQPGFGPPGAPVPPYANVDGYVDVDYTNLTATGSIVGSGVSSVFDFTNFFVTQSLNNFNIGAQPPGDINQHVLSFSYTNEIPNQTSSIYLNSARTLYGTNDALPLQSAVVVCFASGTRIKTTRGEIPVEMLETGESVICSSGAVRPIVWIGQRTIDCARHPRLNEVLPVRVATHAFGENRPTRDLLLSPGHALCIDVVGEVLIPASSLINGTTITQEVVDTVTYWHVELEGGHDILLAENLPAESYLDMGNRDFFAEGEVVVLDASPDAAPSTHADFCRPFHAAGPVVDFIRERLAAQASRLGWTVVENPLADLHLLVDGARIEPVVEGLSVRFLVPATAKTVWLMSNTAVPALNGGGADLRTLGVCVGRLVFDEGLGTPQVVLADDARLCTGFYHIEEGPQRWTAGRARLPAELWAGCRGSFFLRVELVRPALPRWLPPLQHVAA